MIYDEGRQDSAARAKVGLMKIKPLEDDRRRYAVAVREADQLWLVLWVCGSKKGEFFVMTPRADRGWDPHTSCHLDGRMHLKSHGRKVIEQQRQPLTGRFKVSSISASTRVTGQSLSEQSVILRCSPASSSYRPGCWDPDTARSPWTLPKLATFQIQRYIRGKRSSSVRSSRTAIRGW